MGSALRRSAQRYAPTKGVVHERVSVAPSCVPPASHHSARFLTRCWRTASLTVRGERDDAAGGLGALGRVLLEESERGDRVAREIETLMIDHAVAYAVAAQRRAPSRRKRIPIVLIGSTILSSLPGYRSRLYAALIAAIPNAEMRPLREPPALGALLYALDESGAGPTARARAETSLRAAIKKAKPVKI